MWIVKQDVGVFSAIRIRNEKCKSRPIGNKESKIQPIKDKDKKLFRMWNVIFRMYIAITIHIHDGNDNFEWLWY
jgi:hypothetical protein